MPKGPRGEKRPTDAIGAAIKVGRIAVGDEEDDLRPDTRDRAAAAAGAKGGVIRAAKLLPEKRSAIAKKAAAKRWKKKP